MVRTVFISILVLGVWFVSVPIWAAARQEWVQLTDCQYVEQAYNDGDSFHVRCGPPAFILRLYFVDAPEANLRYPDRPREQSEYFGVPLDETLRAGRQATGLVRERLQPPFIIWTRWASAAGRTKTPRAYGNAEVEGQSLAEVLVREGVARTQGVTVTGPTGEAWHVVQARLQMLERTARQHKRGIWATSTAGPTAQATP
jgi:endonuclease YncB( thermonuclease family)